MGFFQNLVYGQTGLNLVPNSSFEELDSCPNNSGQADRLKYWSQANWSSPDIFTPCCLLPEGCGLPNVFQGDQPPLNGENYLGLCYHADSNYLRKYRENLFTELISPLETHKKYIAGFNINVADSSNYLMSSIKLYFSDSVIYDLIDLSNSQWNPLLENGFSLQFDISGLTDTIHWHYLCKYFTGVDKKLITIGNNLPNDSLDFIGFTNPGQWYNLAYYYFEDVFVKEIWNVSIISPDFFCSPSITLSAKNAEEYRWYLYPDTNTVLSSEAILNTTITSSSTFLVKGRICDYVSWDTIQIPILDNCIHLYPNPSAGHLQLNFILPSNSTSTIYFYNNLGQVVLIVPEYIPGNIITLPIIADGVYYYRVFLNGEVKFQNKFLYKGE
jgi:hypothetical protein